MARRAIGIVGLLGALAFLGNTAHGATQDILGIGSTSLSLSSTSIDFFSVAGPNAVDLGTSSGAFGTAGNTATMQNIVFSGGAVSNFINIPALPQAQFTLTAVGPGSPNTVCSGLAAGGSCSAFAGSPFVLTQTSAGTGISFSTVGTVKDSSGNTTTFTATFSTEVVGQTPSALQTALIAGNTISSPFAASINVPSGTFAGTLNVGLSSTSLAATAIGFSPSNVIGPTSTGAFTALSGTTATLKNLSAGGGSVTNFLSVAGLPQVSFTLTSFFPGVANTNCAAVSGVGGSCSPFAGSPFILVDTAEGTALFFTGVGTALDNSTSLQTTFEAIFSTEFTGETPQALATALLAGGTLDGPLSVEFLAGPFSSTATPLPAALPLFATGLGGLGLLGWRRKRKNPNCLIGVREE
jgi:hypothetical protein